MLKKVHRFLAFLDFKVGVYFNLRSQMQETDELNVTTPLSPSYEGRPPVYTVRVLCQICFIGCLKKNVKREKLKKISNIEHLKETALRWKNCSYEYQRVHALVDWEKGQKMAHKACKGTFFKESFLISKEKEAATVASLSITLMKILPLRTRPVSILSVKVLVN